MPGHPEYYGDPFDHLDVAPEARVPDMALRYWGVVPALVTNNKDPDGHGRIKVRFPWLTPEDETDWIRMSTLMAGMKRGTYFLPEVGDEVLVAFEQGEVHRPLCIGVMWNGRDPSPHTNADGKNDIRLIKSRSGHKLIFDDKDGEERITFVDKTGKNRIVWEVKDKTITVQSLEGSIGFKAPEGTLTVNVATLDVKTKSEAVLASDKTVAIQSSNKMVWQGGGEITITGGILNINVSGPAGSGGSASGGAGGAGAGEEQGGGGGAAETAPPAPAGTGGGGGGATEDAASENETEPPPVVVSAAWNQSQVELGGAGGAELSAQVGNIPDGTSASFTIKTRDGQTLGTVSGTVSGGKATAEWTPELPEGATPEFEFEVTCQGKTSKSGILTLVTWVDLTITDPDGKVLPGAEYELVFDDGSKQSGKADAQGHARHEGVYPGKVKAMRVFWKGDGTVERGGAGDAGGTAQEAPGGDGGLVEDAAGEGAGDEGVVEDAPAAGAGAGEGTGAEGAAGEDVPFVAIQLLDPAGEPFPDRDAQVVFDSGETRSAKTDGSGQLRVENPPEGPYRVEIEGIVFEFE